MSDVGLTVVLPRVDDGVLVRELAQFEGAIRGAAKQAPIRTEVEFRDCGSRATKPRAFTAITGEGVEQVVNC